MVAVDSQRRGYHQVTLTEIDTTTIPQVAAGSMVEVGGSLYEADNNETIDTSFEVDPAVGGADTYYICLVPTTGVVTPSWTTYAPEWSDAKQGWYGDGVNVAANCRYVAKCVYDGSSDYTNKEYINYNNESYLFEHCFGYGTTQAITPSAAIIQIDTVEYDSQSGLDTGTYAYTVQSDGYFHVVGHIYGVTNGNPAVLQLRIQIAEKSSPSTFVTEHITYRTIDHSTSFDSLQIESSFYLNKGDKIRLQGDIDTYQFAVTGCKLWIDRLK
jgi:hypothetical protein